MIKKLLILVMCFVVVNNLIFASDSNTNTIGQDASNVIQTPVPFLNIAPDSRAGGMGDVGVATSPDANSLHWNAAKYAFIKDDIGGSITYTPWLRGLATDIDLAYFSFYKKIKRQTIAASIRYFSLGTLTFISKDRIPMGTRNPNEFAIDAAYARMFSDNFSGGIAFRYIRSDLASNVTTSEGQQTIHAGNAFSADISAYYHSKTIVDNLPADWAFGLNISNLGNKISYTDDATKDFLPANLRLGGSFGLDMDSYNKITLAIDLNKLLVPTPTYDSIGSNPTGTDDISVASGMIQSLYKAPGGSSEKLKEIMVSSGLEYLYREQFAIRTGYFYESAMKGNRKYLTVGFGLKMNLLSIDFSYLVPTNGSSSNPLANTMRISLSLNASKLAKKKSGK
jgi:hypothetical protein